MVFCHFQQQLSFMPSVGVEFITQMGVYIPEFVVTAIEAHTSIYHESALNAKITMSNNEIKLSIPAPEGNIQLFSIRCSTVTFTNTLISPFLT